MKPISAPSKTLVQSFPKKDKGEEGVSYKQWKMKKYNCHILSVRCKALFFFTSDKERHLSCAKMVQVRMVWILYLTKSSVTRLQFRTVFLISSYLELCSSILAFFEKNIFWLLTIYWVTTMKLLLRLVIPQLISW